MNIPTTDEMDKLFTKEDIANRYTMAIQCRACKAWTTHTNFISNQYIPCHKCGLTNYDRSSIKSLRSYNRLTDIKRRPK